MKMCGTAGHDFGVYDISPLLIKRANLFKFKGDKNINEKPC